MSAAAHPNAGLPPGISVEDAEKIAQGDMGAIGALVARFKLNKILPLQHEFIAFFATFPTTHGWRLRQAMIDARIPIRDVDRKVKEKREEGKPLPFDPSAIDADNSYGLFTMAKDGLFKAVKRDLIHVCVAFEVLGIMRRALDPGEPKAGAAGWGVLIRFLDSDGHDIERVRRIRRPASQAERGLRHAGACRHGPSRRVVSSSRRSPST